MKHKPNFNVAEQMRKLAAAGPPISPEIRARMDADRAKAEAEAFDPNQVRSILQPIRNRIEKHSDTRKGECVFAAYVVYYVLSRAGYRKVKLIRGSCLLPNKKEGYDHWWVEVDGWYIDLTADQFNDEMPGDENFPDILIESKSECRYHQFSQTINYNSTLKSLGGLERIRTILFAGEELKRIRNAK